MFPRPWLACAFLVLLSLLTSGCGSDDPVARSQSAAITAHAASTSGQIAAILDTAGRWLAWGSIALGVLCGLADAISFIPYPPAQLLLAPFRKLFLEGTIAAAAGLLIATCLVFLSNNTWIRCVAILAILAAVGWRWRSQLLAVVDPPKSAPAKSAPAGQPITSEQRTKIAAILNPASIPPAPPAPGTSP
jgi:hypothetical protein